MELFYTPAPVDSLAFTTKILRKYFGIAAPQFSINEHGKPFLLNSPLRFNLSHSSGVTALAVSTQEVGLDIQKRTERELSALSRRLTPAERAEDFFALWTAKEAYIKYMGGALAGMLASLEYRSGVLYENGSPIPAHLYQTELCGCALCICTASPEAVTLIRL